MYIIRKIYLTLWLVSLVGFTSACEQSHESLDSTVTTTAKYSPTATLTSPPSQIYIPKTEGITTENASKVKQLEFVEFGFEIGPVAFSPSGDILAIASYEDLIFLYNGITGKLLAQIEPDIGYIRSLSFSSDGKLLAAGGGHYSPTHVGAQVWSVATLKQILKLDFSDAVREVAFSPDSSMLATAWGLSAWSCENGSLKLWDVTSGELVSEFLLKGKVLPFEEKTAIEGIGFSPDGTLIAGINCHGMVRIWNVEDLSEFSTLGGTSGWGFAVTFSPDGKLLATSGSAGDSDNTADLRLWDISTGEILHQFEGHASSIRKITFSPDGRILASTSWGDNTVRLWDVETGKVLAVLDASMPVNTDFNPNGTLLATGSSNGVNLWGVPSQ